MAVVAALKRQATGKKSPLDSLWDDLPGTDKGALSNLRDEAAEAEQEMDAERAAELNAFFSEALKDLVSSDDRKMARRGGGDMNAVASFQTRIIDTKGFNVFFGLAVLLNAISMGIEIDHGHKFPEVFDALEWVFCFIFIAELVAKLWYLRWGFFSSAWNNLDFILVFITVVDVLVLGQLAKGNSELKKLSVLRMLRIMRVARMVRFLRIFKELWLIIKGLIDSLKTILWVTIMLFLVLYVFGIFLTRTVGQVRDTDVYAFDDSIEAEFDNRLYFGTVPASMMSLFLITVTADPSFCFAPMLLKQPFMMIMMLFFIMLTTFGVMNVIIGVIVDNVMEAVKALEAEEEDEEQGRAVQVLNVLRELFSFIDSEGTGVIDKHELCKHFKRQEVWSLLKELNLPITDAPTLFTLMSGIHGQEVTYDRFLETLLILTDTNPEKHFAYLHLAVNRLGHALTKCERGIMKQIDEMEGIHHPKSKDLKDSHGSHGSHGTGDTLTPLKQMDPLKDIFLQAPQAPEPPAIDSSPTSEDQSNFWRSRQRNAAALLHQLGLPSESTEVWASLAGNSETCGLASQLLHAAAGAFDPDDLSFVIQGLLKLIREDPHAIRHALDAFGFGHGAAARISSLLKASITQQGGHHDKMNGSPSWS